MLRASPRGGKGIARPPGFIANGDFEQGLTAWHVVSGTAFAGQPVTAASIGSAEVEIDGKPLVGLGGDFWHTPYPIGANGKNLVRVATRSGGILESDPFTISDRFLAYRLGGSAGGAVGLELRIPEEAALASNVEALDAPDADGFVAVRVATPTGADPLREAAWDLGPDTHDTLIGVVAKVRLWVRAGRGKVRRRLLVDHVRLTPKPPPPFHPPLWGWADIHCHPMAQAGFGDLLAGHMHGPVEDLGNCLPLHGHDHGNLLKPVAKVTGHGRHNDGSRAATGWTTGTPAPDDELGFRSWPSFDDLTHIKTHQAWIRRAYDGGQRLMVALVVHNQMLAGLTNASSGTFTAQSDRDTIEPQVQLLREFVAHNRDWCGLAMTPADARDLIEANKMAFVLGLETDSINSWVHFADFPQADTPANRIVIHDMIHDYFAYLRGLGITQVNLIHLSDNAFGGMAIYDFMFIVNSLQRTGVQPKTLPWAGTDPRELVARPVSVGSELWSLLESTARDLGVTIPATAPGGTFGIGDANTKGLTVAGQVALVEAMRLGMVIDTDHMSEPSETKAFEIATTTVGGSLYPLVAAHNGGRFMAPRPLANTSAPVPGSRRSSHGWPTEAMKSETQLDHVKATEGMFGHGIAGADSREFDPATVRNDLPGSSRTVAQGMQYIVSRLPEVPLALGTDWNALLAGPGPRFGPHAGNGIAGELEEGDATWVSAVRAERWMGATAQADGVLYDSPIRDWRPDRFDETELFLETPATGAGHWTWQALALLDSGADLASPEVAAALTPAGSTVAPALELAKGMSGVAGMMPSPGMAGLDYARAAFLAVNPGSILPEDGPAVLNLSTGIGTIRGVWAAMRTGTAPPMRRDTVGPMRDFDYNIDGLAHYGLLPDMLQDLRNVGLPPAVMELLFESAERYIDVWERSVATGARIPH